jgi:uncharacterized secreted protein with C-terminal beta-propeller domain
MVKGFIATVLVVFAASLMLAGCLGPTPQPPVPPGTVVPPQESGSLKSFSSWDEVSEFVRSSHSGGYFGGNYMAKAMDSMMAPTMARQELSSGGASTYSQTNVQVEGVDEADIVKNDGKYIYVATRGNAYYGGRYMAPSYYRSQTGSVSIVEAYPPQSMKVVSKIEIEGTVEGMFVNGNKLVVFGTTYLSDVPPAPPSYGIACENCIMPPYYSQNFGYMRVYDISDRASPKLLKNIEAKGNYLESRMIGSKVYAIFTDYVNNAYPVPLYRVDGTAKEVLPADVQYIDTPDSYNNYNIFLSLDLSDLSKQENRKILLMGNSQDVYVSMDNIYLTYTGYGGYYPQYKYYDQVYGTFFSNELRENLSKIDAKNISDWRKDNLKSQAVQDFITTKIYDASQAAQLGLDSSQVNELARKLSDIVQADYEKMPYYASERTGISKISLNGFSYLGNAEVPGHIVDQFSMDESNGYFRIATTSRVYKPADDRCMAMRCGGTTTTSSNMFVLDSSLKEVGKIEGIAPGESIYSVRFMGSRAYMVTFKKVDPFFVVDLSTPSAPKLLGKLKIPGYSTYLHPYDENYIIGLGKGAVAAEEGDFAWYQGVKLSLFDVRDPENPKEVAKYEIGDRGTDSYALHEHKAFLFSREKNLLVLPVLLAEIDESKYPSGVDANTYGDYVFQGAYAFRVTPESGFTLMGTVSHVDDDSLGKSGDYYWSGASVKRSLYMDDYLYTVSDMYVKANQLPSLFGLSSVQIANGTYGYYG